MMRHYWIGLLVVLLLGPGCGDSGKSVNNTQNGATGGDSSQAETLSAADLSQLISEKDVDTPDPGQEQLQPDSAAPGTEDVSVQQPDLVVQADTAPNLPKPQLKAGASSIDITPSIGVPLGGYGNGERRDIEKPWENIGGLTLGLACVDIKPSDVAVMFNGSKGVHDPIRAKVVVLQSGSERLVLVGLDLVGANMMIHDDLADALKSHNVPSKNIMITATHTHSGPGTLSDLKFWELAAMDCFNQTVYEQTRNKIIKAVLKAIDSLEEAEVGISKGKITGVQKNRRDNPGVFDNTLNVIHLRRKSDQTTIATIVNLPVHPTIMGANNMLFSADFPHYLEKHLQTELGGLGMFLNGTEGDVRPSKSKSGFDGCEEVGVKIANRAIELLPTKYSGNVALSATLLMHDFGTPVLRQGCGIETDMNFCWALPGFEAKMELPSQFFPNMIPIGLMRIGTTLIVGLPGEPTTQVGWHIRDALAQKGENDVILFGLANEHMGYVTTTEEYNIGGYEALATMFGPDTYLKLTDGVIKALSQLP